MKLKLYAVKDDLCGFKQISMSENDAMALRDFSYACNSNELIKMNAKNFAFYRVGEYDTENGIINTDGCPCLIANGDSLVRKEQENNV